MSITIFQCRHCLTFYNPTKEKTECPHKPVSPYMIAKTEATLALIHASTAEEYNAVIPLYEKAVELAPTSASKKAATRRLERAKRLVADIK